MVTAAGPAEAVAGAEAGAVAGAVQNSTDSGPTEAAGANGARTRADRWSPERPSTPAAEAVALPRPADPQLAAIWDAAATVTDPELPVLTIADLGMLRGVRLDADGTAVVQLTPTYSGCPAVEALRTDIVAALAAHGVPARVEVVLAPAWTTDWMSGAGRTKLEAYGIAPPRPRGAGGTVALGLGVRCPRCRSLHTRELARFASTSCKALWQCQACGEPFDRFKEL
ncbi:hypothetical protein GCM10027411_20730 [Microbacterium aureliae]